MMFLFPRKKIELSVQRRKDDVLEAIRANVQKPKTFQTVFSKRSLFEGDIYLDKFDLKFVGKHARSYQVKILGEINGNDESTELKITVGVTLFGRIITLIWFSFMLLFSLFSIYIFFSQSQIIVLTFAFVSILILIIGILYNFYGYRYEVKRVLQLIQEIVEGKK